MPDVFSTLEDTDPRTVLDYTSRDFTAVRAQLVGLARGFMPEWQTVGEASDFGTLLLELYAYVADVMHFYIDRTASEAFLGTALRRQSVLYIADMLGYVPIGQQSAIVELEFNLVDDPALPADYEVVIPVGTRVHNNASDASQLIVFELNTEIKLKKGETVTAVATEGVMVYDSALGKSQGATNTEMIILDKGVVYNSVSVKTREGGSIIDWTYTSDLSLARPTQPAFTTFIDDNEYTHIVFGDNAVGRVPPVNADVFATYRFGVGAEANALVKGDLEILVADTTTTTSNFWGVSVTNPEPPVGGTDPETIDAMRNSIPRAAARIKNRAITLNDYADLALQVPGVAKSMSHGEIYTAVHVVIAPNQGQGPDEYMELLCASVQRYMQDKVIVGSQVYVHPETGTKPLITQLWWYVFIRVMVHVQEAYNRTTVRLAVENAIRQMMAFDAVDFGTRISLGNIYRTSLAIQGVEWVDLFWLASSTPEDAVTTYTVTNKVLAANVATLTIGTHTFIVGNQVEVAGVDPVFNGLQIVTAIAATTISYAKINAPVVSVAATGTVSSLPPTTVNVTNKVLAANVATLTIGTHSFHVGDQVRVLGVDTVFDGYATITVVTATTISYARINAPVTAVAATGTVSPKSVNIWMDDDQRLVGDIVPDALHIPKIDSTSIVASIVDYPDESLEERTHDGLWVRATGGLIGT